MNNGEFINCYRRPGILVLGKTKKQSKIIDFVVPGYQNMKSKDQEKILNPKIQNGIWNVRAAIVLIVVGALVTQTKVIQRK